MVWITLVRVFDIINAMENIVPDSPGTSGEVGKEKYLIGIIIFILAIAVMYLAWYVNKGSQMSSSSTPPSVSVVAPITKKATSSPEAQVSLGGGIYEQAQNPIKEKIPENVAPVGNPIGGAYKNPFE